MSIVADITASFSAWPYAYGAISLGALGGTFLVMIASRGAGPAGESTAQADLTTRRDTLYTQLRELDDTRDKLDADVYKVERDKLLTAAADVLRKLEVVPEAAPRVSLSKDEPAWSQRHPRLSAMLYGLAAAAIVLGFKAALDEYTRPRGEGDSITGGGSAMSAGGGGMGGGMGGSTGGGSASGGDEAPAKLPPELQAQLDALQVKASMAPDDLQAQNDYAHALIGTGQVMAAWKIADAVVKVDAENPEARVHQAITLLHIGDEAMATKLLDKVLEAHPDQSEALGYRGALYAQHGERALAIATWEKAKAADPSQASVFNDLIAGVDQIIAQAAAEAAAPSAAPSGTGPMGGGSGSAAGGGAEAASGPPEFTGEVRLAPGVTGSGTLFIYVRAEGQTSGPPLRALHLPGTFPATFSIGAGDSPMHGSLPSGNVQISARLDADGNAMTKDPSDPVAISAPLVTGGPAVVLELAPTK